jgi:hypothetical protein
MVRVRLSSVCAGFRNPCPSFSYTTIHDDISSDTLDQHLLLAEMPNRAAMQGACGKMLVRNAGSKTAGERRGGNWKSGVSADRLG